ncbi:hypothetical protein EDB85DRAFT_2171956 [Lactarius pseudohatsudake]|nr:hypothetical protein EDB85DRAFT_2171956 [Lactarius pseudohatsudake]
MRSKLDSSPRLQCTLRWHKRRVSRAADLPPRRRGVAEGEGDHVSENSAFLERFVDVSFLKWVSRRDMAYHYKLAHVRSLDPASQATQLAALDAIATAVSDPTIFDFDPVLKLDSVLAAQPYAEVKGQGRAGGVLHVVAFLLILLIPSFPPLSWHGSIASTLQDARRCSQ